MKLNEAGVTLIDCDHKTPTAQTSGYPYVGIPQLKNGHIRLDGARLISEEDFVLWTKKAKPKHNDVILSRRCNPGESAYVPEGLEIALGQNLVLLRSDGSVIYPPFLRWLVQGNEWWKQVNKFLNVGAVFNSLKCKDIPNFNLTIPSLNEQKRITDILSSLDNKIELNNKVNQTLESIAQALFKSWFIDFDPVRAKIVAKLEGADPEIAAMCAISGKSQEELKQMSKDDFAELQATAELFPDELVESELGEVPRGWDTVNIGSLIDLTIGGDWGKEVKDEKYSVQARVIRGTDIPNIKCGSEEQVPIRFIESKKLKNRELTLGDIVIEVSGGSPKQPTGRTIYISNEILFRLKDPVIPASFCRLLRPKSQELAVFLAIYLQIIYAEGKTWLYQNQSTGISNFQTTVFLEKEILSLPSLSLLKKFEKITVPMINKIDSSERLYLTNIRDTLLPKLLSGEVEVSDLQGEVT
ncbi:restriction endonuclease subunit S [Acinetobacter sp. SWAC57]|uniref:restriction endonuclease subunit S n=1 Tax=Acinetobacter sp. SWAC57 TaxID=2293834 RepID=UPI000E5AF016|nr:restriction endonuclease subunit S [Acinetobacter sp. SWAC57]